MPTNLPDQNWTVPAGPDLADNPFAFTDYSADVIQNVILRYPNIATRDAFNGSRIAGDMSFTLGRTWYDRWTGTKWIPCTAITVAKTANQIVNNSVALVNDAALVAPLPAANTYYLVSIPVRYTSSTTADIKFSLTLPAGATGFLGGPGLTTAAAGQTGDADFEAVTIPAVRPFGGAGGATFTLTVLRATVLTAGTTGNCQLQWAQNTLDATNTTVFAQSMMKIEAIQ
jgi:hypothetical protein